MTSFGPAIRDTVYGGDGDDTLRDGWTTKIGDGSAGHGEVFYGGAGNDHIVDHGQTHMWGGTGDDTLDASGNWYWSWWAKLHGGEGNDVIKGGVARDTLSGGAGDDWINGGNRADKLYGGDGNDTLDGERGHDDKVYGEGGDDLKDHGRSQMWGGAGNDTLDAPGSATVPGGPSFTAERRRLHCRRPRP